jgi:hypothetical protein
MDPLYTAQPREWYLVREVEAGWALGIWEYDSLQEQEWILLDESVRLANVDHETEQQLFLSVMEPTEAYSVTMDPVWVAQPGERYFVREIEAGWALVIWEHDPATWQEWIQLDGRVQLGVDS